ncbi:MAG: ribonuclease HI [Bdellovibrionota bacterium]
MKIEMMTAFTDGACSGNPGPGGWGSVIISTNGNVTEIGGRDPSTTNNRMEMMAVIKVLEAVKKSKEKIQFFTDSLYVLRGITQWSWGWQKKSWKTAEGQEVLNKDLWIEMLALVQEYGRKNIDWHYCRGHQGIPGNERCDEIAVAFSKGMPVNFYRGPLNQYSIDILKFPVIEPWPEMKSHNEKKPPAFSYLSLIGNIVTRHPDWGSCERRVKGKSGAKFKKTKSSDDEKEILKSWGLNPDQTTIKND